MAKKRPTTRAERKAKTPATLPNRFEPRFLEQLDQRLGVVKLIKKRVQQLTEDAGADSTQKRMLVRRAVFICVRLETMESEAIETGHLDFGPYVQAVNSLKGILNDLGIEKRTSDELDDLQELLSE